MKKSLLSFFVKGVFIYALVQGGCAFGQNNSFDGEKFEQLLHHFQAGLAQVQKDVQASNEDFNTFKRFNEKRINEEEGYLSTQIRNGKIDASNIEAYQKAIVKKYTGFYKDFLSYRNEYPSSISEYASANPPRFFTANCDSACTNPDFASGTLNGWWAGYARNSSLGHPYFNVTGLTGAMCGPVTQAAQDPNTGNTWQVTIQTLGNDPIVPSIPRVSPFSASAYSARVGDGTGVTYGVAVLQETFQVTAATDNFTYQYALVLQNPTGHTQYTQPFFQAVVLDSLGDTIPQCGKYLVTSGYETNGSGWDSTIYQSEKLFYKNWTSVFTPLKAYIGQCVTVRFTTGDCGQGGHFGYAYVTASCSPAGLLTSSPAFCGQSAITLTAPPGGDNYRWTGPYITSIVGSDSNQTCIVDSAGTYTVVVTPVTGSSCNDTLTINIPKAPGPVPHPNFSADTICAGQTMQFTNLSTPIGGKFYWDFYNIGTYTDSTTNPTYTYNTAGNYTVKLHELNNGCGADTLISVKVDSNVTGTFVNNTVCVGSPMTFTNNTLGADKYLWNFGDPPSGTADTSTMKNPTHTYNTAGTYSVTLAATNAGGCNDTIRLTVNVVALPKPSITGPDSVCNGSQVLLTATAPGATTWSWMPIASVSCPTCNSTNVNPTVTTTYTVTADNGFCTDTAQYTVRVLPVPNITIKVRPANDTICLGDSAKLIGMGGCTYTWAAPISSTNDSVWVKPLANTTYSLSGKCSGCSAGTTVTIKVMPIISPTLSLTKDSICPTDSAGIVLHLGGATQYKWLPPINSTRDTAYVRNANTYKVVVYSYCGNDTLQIPVHTSPVPVIRFSGNTEICKGSATPWTITGGSQYTWTPSLGLSCNNCPNPNASPIVTTTYTVQVSNGKCAKDTTIKMTVAQPFVAQIFPNPSCVCLGSCSILTAKGGGTYHWLNNNNVDSVITVCPTRDSTFKVAVDKVCKDTAKINICVDAPSFIACCDTTVQMNGSAALSVYSPSSSNASYSWLPTTGLSCINCPNPIATPTATTTYTVTMTDSAGCITSRVITVEIACDDFTMPNVFTPNDDGVNDDFVPYYYYNGVMYNGISNLSSYSIKIYDRWGKLVYSSTDYRTYWNGRINNTDNLVPDGVYYWVIDATCVSGTNSNSYNKKGFVQVIGEK